jgi:hypothetical protein
MVAVVVVEQRQFLSVAPILGKQTGEVNNQIDVVQILTGKRRAGNRRS